MTEVPLSDGWTARPYVEAGYVYVEWIRTGSRDPVPDIPPMTPHEAVEFAEALVGVTRSGSREKGWYDGHEAGWMDRDEGFDTRTNPHSL